MPQELDMGNILNEWFAVCYLAFAGVVWNAITDFGAFALLLVGAFVIAIGLRVLRELWWVKGWNRAAPAPGAATSLLAAAGSVVAFCAMLGGMGLAHSDAALAAALKTFESDCLTNKGWHREVFLEASTRVRTQSGEDISSFPGPAVGEQTRQLLARTYAEKTSERFVRGKIPWEVALWRHWLRGDLHDLAAFNDESQSASSAASAVTADPSAAPFLREAIGRTVVRIGGHLRMAVSGRLFWRIVLLAFPAILLQAFIFTCRAVEACKEIRLIE
jgi:hypothetical protein